MAETKFGKILEAIETAGFVPQAYSGRGMYGSQCLGFTCGDAMDSVLLVIAEFASSCDDASEVAELASELRGMRTDSMGRDVIAYWPSIDWNEELAAEVGCGSTREDEDDEDDVLDVIGPEVRS